jgi:hypothetical protein
MSNKDLTYDVIRQLAGFYEEIEAKMVSDPAAAIQEFYKGWPLFTYEERKVLMPLFVFKNTHVQTEANVTVETRVCWSVIGIKSQELFIEDEDLPVLTFNGDKKELAKGILRLKIKGGMEDSNQDIAKGFAKLFDVNYATLYSYLNDPEGHLGGAEFLFDK